MMLTVVDMPSALPTSLMAMAQSLKVDSNVNTSTHASDVLANIG